MKIDKYTYFVSGAEPDNYFEMIMQETNTCLMSYQILQRKGKKFLHNRISKFPEMKMLLDSGAHTFIQHKEEYENKDWEEYLGKYTAFIRANKNNILAAAELDIDDLVGTDKVNEWRERYFEPLEKEGVNIIYVWHGKRGLDEWERMCKKYSYVGISLNEKGVDFSDTTLNRMFNTAKKYKTMIHGFAVAGSKELMKFPFTTSDSSTWLVGTQFGEINYFDGRTMMRLKKDKWKRQYKNKLIKAGAKWKLLEREDAYEMQRMCLVAFIDMEKHIQKVMKNKWYWTKRTIKLKKRTKSSNESVSDIERGTVPSKKWFEGEKENWKEYCEALGISVDIEKDVAVELLDDFRVFINDTDEIDKFETEYLYGRCNDFGVPTSEANTRIKAIEKLKMLFKQHANGEIDTFANFGADDVAAKPKERESYFEEPEFITMDVTENECNTLLSGLLQEAGQGMPEVDAYDAELLKMNIVPIRDESGKFLKGQRKIRKPKKLLSGNMPKFSCNTCYKGQDCPEYKEGYVCAYDKEFGKFNTRSIDDIIDVMHSMVELNVERLERQAMFERMDSGIADPAVSSLIDQNMKLLMQLKDLGQAKVIAKQHTIMKEDGSSETITTVNANPSPGGVLSNLFSAFANKKEKKEDDEIIDVTPEKEGVDEKEK